MKCLILGNTGKGKTALAIFLCRLYRENNPKNIIYSNFNLNISLTVYTEFGFIPSSTIFKGNSLIVFDDIVNLGNIKGLITYLAVVCRKTNTDMILTAQDYVDIPRKLRDLCHYQIEPHITNLEYSNVLNCFRMTKESELIYELYNPKTLDYINSHTISDILIAIKGYYNTNEIPKRPIERIIKKEIAKYSKNLDDIEFNVSIWSNDKRDQKRLIREICIEKNINFK